MFTVTSRSLSASVDTAVTLRKRRLNADGMGALCSTAVDKDGEEPSEEKHHISSQKIQKMPPFRQRVTRSTTNWRAAIANREFTDEASYTKALEQLQNAERNRAFDGQVAQQATKIENEAAAIVKKIRAYDWERTYGPPVDKDGQQTGKRTEGEHFLGNVDLINSTLLMQVAKKMPKGAHLHIHWNSCLPARFLIEQARDVEAMYIRSTLPLTSPKNMAESRISFMVLTKQEAMPLGDVWDANYVSNRWMPYKQFQQRFHVEDENGTTLIGTSGAETWLESKMIIHESEAYSVHQTGRGIWEKFNHRTQMMKVCGNNVFFTPKPFLTEQLLTGHSLGFICLRVSIPQLYSSMH